MSELNTVLLYLPQEAEINIMDASEDDQLAAAIAASMQGHNGDSDEGEMKQTEDAIDYENKHEEETVQESVVTLTPEPDGNYCMSNTPYYPSSRYNSAVSCLDEAGSPNVTRVQIRVPDGSRLTRRFLKTDPLAMVWSFVKDKVPEARGRAFELRSAFPLRAVAYNDTLSIEEGKLENASLMVRWL